MDTAVKYLIGLGIGAGIGVLLAKSAEGSTSSAPLAPGQQLSLYNTFYDFPVEDEFSGAQDTEVLNMTGNVIARVPASFLADVCIEGAGRLTDGRVINFAGTCTYGYACMIGGGICYSVLDSARYPWGAGTHGSSLVPFRSIATDPAVIPFGTTIYIPQWDGVEVPLVGGVGGFTHDGLFVASDEGGRIRRDHIDIFVGPRSMVRTMDRILPSGPHFVAYVGAQSRDALRANA